MLVSLQKNEKVKFPKTLVSGKERKGREDKRKYEKKVYRRESKKAWMIEDERQSLYGKKNK